MHELSEKKTKPLFAPGQICYPDETQAVLRQAGVQGIALLCRHLAGDWGEVDEKRRRINYWTLDHPQDERRLPIISRFSLPGGRQVMVITYHVHSPAQRRTHLLLWPPPIVKQPVENGGETNNETGKSSQEAQPDRKRKKRAERSHRQEVRK